MIQEITMVWLKRRFEWAEYRPYFDLLEQLLLSNAALYQEFLMVSTNTQNVGVSDYYIGLPHEAFAAGFEGFERVGEAELPKRINVLHIGDATKEPFISRFHFEVR
jgi:hypothetical protein